MGRIGVYLLNDRSIALVLVGTQAPVLETYHHHGVRGTATGEGETGHLVVGLDLLDVLDAVLHLGQNVIGLGKSGTGSRVHTDEERTGILVGHQGCLRRGHEVHKQTASRNKSTYTYPLVLDEELHSAFVLGYHPSE